VYFLPVGNFTRNHFGLGSLGGKIVSIAVSINKILMGKDTISNLEF